MRKPDNAEERWKRGVPMNMMGMVYSPLDILEKIATTHCWSMDGVFLAREYLKGLGYEIKGEEKEK
jgi:hypothetical protein